MMDSIFRWKSYCSVYEIYPQSESPHLTKIAHLDFSPTKDPPVHLLPETVIWSGPHHDRIVFQVWDYRLNHSIFFFVDVDVDSKREVDFILFKVLKLASNSSVGR